MNKIFYAALVMATAVSFSSCVNEEDDIFDQSAAERLNAASALYSERLGASPNGWAMQLYPTTEDETPFGNGYLLLCDFDPDQSVRVAMNNELSNNQYVEDRSAWEVITDNGPVLTFNTYNSVMHTFSNPEDVSITTGVTEDETGTGIGGDYEFIIVDAPEDASYMMLKGKKRGTYNLLTPLEEGVDYEEYLEDVKDFQSTMFPESAPNSLVMTLGDDVYEVDSIFKGLPNIYPYGTDYVMNENFSPFLITKLGDEYYLRFRDAFTNTAGETAQRFVYDVDEDIFKEVDTPEFTIAGPNPTSFCAEWLNTLGNKWQYQSKNETSSKVSEIVSALSSDLASFRYTFRSMEMQKIDDVLRVSFIFRNSSNRNGTATYLFGISEEDDGITLNYQGPLADTDANILSRAPNLQSMLNALSDKFVASKALTNFDLSSIRLTSASDSDVWFVVNATK